MKKIIYTLICIFLTLNLISQSLDDKFKEADKLFNKGKYQEAMKLLDEIKKGYRNPLLSLKADLEILKNTYYNWDLKKAEKLALQLLETPEITDKEYYQLKFDTYWWLINTYNALKDKDNELKTQEELLQFYQANINHLEEDKRCKRIYNNFKKKLKN